MAPIAGVTWRENVPLRTLTRFGLGGPAQIVADASTPEALMAALDAAQVADIPYALIGGGSNLVASDEGFPGAVLRYTAAGVEIAGEEIRVEAGVVLQNLVDASVDAGLEGLHTMTGIPGWVGGAIYGNAGAYGHSIHEFISSVRYFDGDGVRQIGNGECQFRYRESIFKQRKDWIILDAVLRLPKALDASAIRTAADGILMIRNEKYPPTMRCAGSIFKNLILAELTPEVQALVPPHVVREGKVASAYFLEQVGAKGMFSGDIRVADYHANLIYNTGAGTATQVRHLIAILKDRVSQHFGLVLEEEVQYL
ncbi:MAG: UDP-N-acetylmuramate dehydrogenase [Acidobacteriota bacterium]